MLDILLLCAFVCGLTWIVYILATYGTRETSFEEALAEQRRKREQEQAQIRADKQKRKDKHKLKKLEKKELHHEPEPVAATSELESVPPPAEPEVDKDSAPIVIQEKKKDKKKKKDLEESGGNDEIMPKTVVEEVHPLKEGKLGAMVNTAAKVSDKGISSNMKPKGQKISQKGSEKPASNKMEKDLANKVERAQMDKQTPEKEVPVKVADQKSSFSKGVMEKNSTVDSSRVARGNSVKEEVESREQREKGPPNKVTAEKIQPKGIQDKSTVIKSSSGTFLPPGEQKSEAQKISITEVDGQSAVNEADPPLGVAVQLQQLDMQVSPVQTCSPVERRRKKNDKKERGKADSAVGDVPPRLAPLIEKASFLNSAELQSVIDALLNKQGINNTGGEWVEKGRIDPATQLRRQLEEAEARYKQQQEAQEGLSAKIADLRTELNAEKTRNVQCRRQLAEKTGIHQRELDLALNNAAQMQDARLKELRAGLEREFKTKLQQQLSLKNEDDQKQLQQLAAALEDSKRNLTTAIQEKDAATQRCQQYEQHMSCQEEQYKSDEAALKVRLAELQSQLGSAESQRVLTVSQVAQLKTERDQLNLQVAQYNQEKESSRDHLTQMQHKLQEALKDKSELESQVNHMKSEIKNTQQMVEQQKYQIECLNEEKESLASQSVRPAAEGQENGDIHPEQSVIPAKDAAHLEIIIQEKDRLIEQKEVEATSLKKEIGRLKEQFDGQKVKNDELRVKNHNILEALRLTEERLRARLIQNNEANRQQDMERRQTRGLLKRLFPDVRVEDSMDHDALLKTFETVTIPEPKIEIVEKTVEKVVEKVVEDPQMKARLGELQEENLSLRTKIKEHEERALLQASEIDERITSLQEENRGLLDKIANYQVILGNTEDLLKSLEASVETEEKTWRKKIEEKDSTVHQLTAEKANLHLKLKQLEDTLENAKQAEEGQSQLEALQNQLRKEEQEKSELQKELLSTQEKLAATETQAIEVGRVEDGGVSVSELLEENAKLRALINMGQDSSRQQEQLITQLQEELTAAKSGSTNGPSNVSMFEEGGGLEQ